MDTPLYGGVLMSIGYLAIFLKNFFCGDCSWKTGCKSEAVLYTKKGGDTQARSPILNNCSDCLGYLRKKRKAARGGLVCWSVVYYRCYRDSFSMRSCHHAKSLSLTPAQILGIPILFSGIRIAPCACVS